MPDQAYVKRYRMELRLRRPFPPPALPPGFYWLPWSDDLLDVHAEVKRRCFAAEQDALVFPNLGHATGCRLLMRAIRDSAGFCPAATWLAACADGCVGTIQGLLDGGQRLGAVQNVGVLPGYRGCGIGRALVVKALHGFLVAGAARVYLEVTAGNGPAVRLYRGLGFRPARTLYRGVARPIPDGIGAGI
jgi:ribosomal protein S18 acetylase RimI-like enzyme